MKHLIISLIALFICLNNAIARGEKFRFYINNDNVELNEEVLEIIEDPRLLNVKAVKLKPNVKSATEGERSEADIIFKLTNLDLGRYVMRTHAVTDTKQDSIFAYAKSKYESLYFKMQFEDSNPTRRVIAVPWNRPLQTTGIFNLSEKNQCLKIWLPKGVHLEYIEFSKYIPPNTPYNFEEYKPKHTPPVDRPRLWITKDSLNSIRSRLDYGENAEIWASLQTRAHEKFKLDENYGNELPTNKKLENNAIEKAFYYLIIDDEKIGYEAVSMIDSYLPYVEYGNLLDVTIDIGRTIYASSLVYDWCYKLLTDTQREVWVNKMISLAEQMEIGWPPFRQSVINGHGNEAQLSRDLLTMSIAIYDEFPEAYQYTYYRVFEQLIPMKQLEYSSPRHAQGVNYGDYRIRWDLHAAWIFKRMLGKEVFDPNIKEVSKFWTYMRTPDGQMFRDGDGYGSPEPNKSYYWQRPVTRFLAYTYNGSALDKAEFMRQGGISRIEPYMFLLLNRPDLSPNFKYDLPLTIDFGDVTGGMIARTGWESPSDVIVEIKGGGYRNGAHQHADAGSIQVYYRGFLIGDIGMYGFAGTDYDVNFNRRSVAHSMMLVNDTNEDFGKEYGRRAYNDWGQRYNAPPPSSYHDAISNPIYNNGVVISCSFGPSMQTPKFSYFSIDLESPYSDKVSDYVRSFNFINTGRNDIPGVVVVTDIIVTADSTHKKYLQFNSLSEPIMSGENLLFTSKTLNGFEGNLNVDILLPKQKTIDLLKNEEVYYIDGVYFEPPVNNFAERNGSRTLISPNSLKKINTFLTVMQITDSEEKVLPINLIELDNCNVITIAENILVMSNSMSLIDNSFNIEVPDGDEYSLAITGIKDGSWNIVNEDKTVYHREKVNNRSNTIFLDSIPSGRYSVTLDPK